jgi:eukaryotic-like serine/threonine-protein kinase
MCTVSHGLGQTLVFGPATSAVRERNRCLGNRQYPIFTANPPPGEMATFEEQLKDSLSHAYNIERELGGGGMSRVFVATDRILGRKIVIKLLSPELIAEVNRGRFRREIQVAAQLQHPHIVTLLSAGEDGDLVYYTMPFIEGESLKSALEKEGKLSVADVVRVLYDVVDALSYAHARGVVHRDIKPANILRSGSHALVTDFGVAKALNAAMPTQAMTSTGMAIGTPAYMAPEQLAGDPAADHRIDIYAVGLLAYELLAGKSPFAAANPQGVLAAVLTKDPRPLNEVRVEVPRNLSAVIMQCLSKLPGGRPPSAEALLDALDMIATASGEIRTREHTIPARHRTKTVPVPVVAQESDEHPAGGSRKRILVAVLGLVLLAGTAGAYAFNRSGQPIPITSANPAEPSASGTGSTTAQPTAAANANAVVAQPVITPLDSVTIAATVRRILSEAAEVKKPGAAVLNVDSLRRRVQRDMIDSIARANPQRAAVTPPIAAAVTPPVATTITSTTTSPTPLASGKRRLAITDPKESKDQPVLNAFSRALVDALRASIDNGDAFALVDQDSVREAVSQTKTREEAARILKPDIVLSPSYVGTGDAVNLMVTVWDLRSNSSYGIRVTSTRIEPGHPEIYLGSVVQSVLKQLDDLARAPTIYRK